MAPEEADEVDEVAESKIQERKAWTQPGLVAAALVAMVLALAIASLVVGILDNSFSLAIVGPLLALATLVVLPGFFVVQPNRARVLVAFGRYLGSVSEPGWHWGNPLSAKQRKRVSLREQNFTTDIFKLNDLAGNPIEIAATIVWRVEKPVMAVFGVENYSEFVLLEAETAVRFLGSSYPYEDYDGNRTSLRTDPIEVSAVLLEDLQERLSPAGVRVLHARVSHLTYAPEIAEAMLRRQYAAAVVGARRQIVEGAVSTITDALEMLAKLEVVEFDNDHKAAMVSELLLELARDQTIQRALDAAASNEYTVPNSRTLELARRVSHPVEAPSRSPE